MLLRLRCAMTDEVWRWWRCDDGDGDAFDANRETLMMTDVCTVRCDAMRCGDAKWFSALRCPCGCDSLVLVLNCVAASSSSSSRSASCVVLSGQSSKLLTSNCRTLSQHRETTTTRTTTTRRKTQLVHALLKDADRTCSVRRQHRNLGVVLARSTRHSHTRPHTHTRTIKLMNMGRTQTWDKYAVGI